MATDRPILFSGPMVRAILDNRKRQTRRIVKPMPQRPIEKTGGAWWDDAHDHSLTCRYGRPGDRLWVRETWAYVPATAWRRSDGVQQTGNPDEPDMAAVYAAGWDRSRPGRWRPSIHMPRWASRITLKITGVRIERLQEITEHDAINEGIEIKGHCWKDYRTDGAWSNPINSYWSLWDAINGAGSWDTNPWVWVVEFERVLP
jgi:hypothetical protein